MVAMEPACRKDKPKLNSTPTRGDRVKQKSAQQEVKQRQRAEVDGWNLTPSPLRSIKGVRVIALCLFYVCRSTLWTKWWLSWSSSSSTPSVSRCSRRGNEDAAAIRGQRRRTSLTAAATLTRELFRRVTWPVPRTLSVTHSLLDWHWNVLKWHVSHFCRMGPCRRTLQTPASGASEPPLLRPAIQDDGSWLVHDTLLWCDVSHTFVLFKQCYWSYDLSAATADMFRTIRSDALA